MRVGVGLCGEEVGRGGVETHLSQVMCSHLGCDPVCHQRRVPKVIMTIL